MAESTAPSAGETATAQSTETTTAPSTESTAPTVGETTGSETNSAPTADPFAARPFTVEVPNSYSGSTPAPLLVVLHGYTSSSTNMKALFDFASIADERGFLSVYANGTKDLQGNPFWNATNACCNFGSSSVDDSGYLMHIIESAKSRYNVDAKRIWVAGHSNGGFMAYRMACEHADVIAGIVSLAGATFEDAATCQPSGPVSVMQVHGTSDEVISYDGGQIFGQTFPSALATATAWARYNGCDTDPVVAANPRSLDLDTTIEGNDSGLTTFNGCPSGVAVELLSIDGGLHSPTLSANFPTTVIDFLYNHPKP